MDFLVVFLLQVLLEFLCAAVFQFADMAGHVITLLRLITADKLITQIITVNGPSRPKLRISKEHSTHNPLGHDALDLRPVLKFESDLSVEVPDGFVQADVGFQLEIAVEFVVLAYEQKAGDVGL